MRIALLLMLALALPTGAAAGDAEPDEAPAEAEAPPKALDLTLRYDPKRSREDMAWGAIKVIAKVESTQIYLDGEPIGTGQALRTNVMPGLHVLEARLPSGRKLSTSVLVRPGARVEYEVNLGSKKGEDAYIVLMNVVSLLATTLVGSAMAVEGSVPITTDMPGLTTGLDAMKSGNRQLPRP